MLNKHQIFSLINVANIKSPLLSQNFANSIKSFNQYSDKTKGIPLLVPADDNLFDFTADDIFTLPKSQILKVIYDISNESYVGFKHAFKQFKFLSNFEVKEIYKPFVNSINAKNSEIMSYVNKLNSSTGNIGAFQTRNIPHLGHEIIIKRLLEVCDHVVINPVVGPKKKGDVRIEFLRNIYNYLSETKYKEKISFKPIFANMYYAGPREAIHHAYIRQRIGFDYFTIGRDHAGAESVYQPELAGQLIKENYDQLKIKIIVHEGAMFCPKCDMAVIVGDCPHSKKCMIDISGSEFRSSIGSKQMYKFADEEMQNYLFQQTGAVFEL